MLGKKATGCGLQATGKKAQVKKVSIVGYEVRGKSNELLVTGYWLLVTGYWLLVKKSTEQSKKRA